MCNNIPFQRLPERGSVCACFLELCNDACLFCCPFFVAAFSFLPHVGFSERDESRRGRHNARANIPPGGNPGSEGGGEDERCPEETDTARDPVICFLSFGKEHCDEYVEGESTHSRHIRHPFTYSLQLVCCIHLCAVLCGFVRDGFCRHGG